MSVTIWLIKAILSHLLTDFFLQPTTWIKDRKKYHFASSRLYMHGTLTGIVAWLLLGITYWLPALIILITHTIIDPVKYWTSDSGWSANENMIAQQTSAHGNKKES